MQTVPDRVSLVYSYTVRFCIVGYLVVAWFICNSLS